MLDFQRLERSSRPNNYLLADETAGDPPDGPAPVIAAPLEKVQAALKSVIAEEPRVKTVFAEDGDPQWAFVQRSAVFGFPDDVTIAFGVIPAGAGGEAATRLSIYSRARVGYSDFGVNKKRVERWLEGLRSKL